MNIKPKKTTFNSPALVYRRVTRTFSALSYLNVYKCENHNGDLLYFVFDKDEVDFVEIELPELEHELIVVGTSSTMVFTTKDQNGKIYYFYWNSIANNNNGAWVKSETIPESYTTLRQAGFANIGKYQTNAYVYVGQVDYIITGEVAGTKTQHIKGLIMPLQSMNIKYYDDSCVIDEEDLVVVNGALYSAESPDYSIKHMPRPYKIYYVTLNSIL